MSIEVSAVQRIRVITEAAGSFATDQTGSLGSFVDVPAMEGTATVALGQEMLDPAYAQQHKDGRVTHILGRKSCSLSFSVPLASTGTAAASGISAVQGALGLLLAATMGGEDLGAGTTISDAGVADTDFDVASATGLTAGTAMGVLVGTTTEWRVIENIATLNVTPKLNFSASPSNGAVVNSCATYYLKQDPDTSLQFAVYGAEQDDRWLLQGCQLQSMTLEVTSGQIPKITFTFSGATWTYGASTSTPITGSAIATATYSNVSPVAAVSGVYYQQTAGTATYSASTSRLDVSQEAWSPAMAYVPQTSPTGVQTVLRWVRNRVNPVVSFTFNVPYQDTTWFAVRDAKTVKAFVRQFGSGTAGSTVLIEIPSAQVVDVQRVDDGGLAYQTVSCAAGLDTDIASNTGDQSFSPLRFHLC